jgi:HEAT repeat protein
VLIVACGATFWAWRTVWESRNPVLAAARRLEAPDASRRLAAIQEITELGTTGAGEALQPLIPTLSDRDPAVRRAAAQAIGNVGSATVKSGTESEAVHAAVQGLLTALKDPDPSVRIAATSALRVLAGMSSGASSRGSGTGAAAKSAAAGPTPSVIDPAAVNAALLELLADKDPEVRQAALVAVGSIASDLSGEPPKGLFAAMNDESAANRAVAINTLSGFRRGLDSFIPPLLQRLESDEPVVREACSRALGRIKPSALTSAVAPALIEGLRKGDREVRLRTIPLVARISPDVGTAVPVLIEVLQKEPMDSDHAAIDGMSLVTTYRGPAQEAAAELGRIAPGSSAADQAIAALNEILRSGPAPRRASAADALGQFGTAAAVALPALISVLEESETGKATTRDKASAATALGRVAPGTSSAEHAVAALTAVLKSDSIPNRTAAIRALPSFGKAAASAIPAIRTLAENDPIPNVRKAAASAREALEDGSRAPAPKNKRAHDAS